MRTSAISFSLLNSPEGSIVRFLPPTSSTPPGVVMLRADRIWLSFEGETP